MRDSTIPEAVQAYPSVIHEHQSKIELHNRVDRSGDGSIKVTDIGFGTGLERHSGHWVTGEDALVVLDYECSDERAYSSVEVAIGIRTLEQRPLLPWNQGSASNNGSRSWFWYVLVSH